MQPIIHQQSGFSLIEVMIGAAILSALIAAAAIFFDNQSKANGALEFMSKRETLRLVTIGQFLNQSDNCKCLFRGANAFPTAGIAKLAGTNPRVLGTYDFTTPGDCTSATIPMPWLNDAGIDGLRTSSIELQDIRALSVGYQGEFVVTMASTKQVLGSSRLSFRIPVGVATTPSGTNRQFESCGIYSGPPEMSVHQDFILDAVSAETDKTQPASGWRICVYAGSATTADDDDMYDSCIVDTLGSGNFLLRLKKHSGDSLQCKMTCFR